jgi:cellulose synthase/poly-beta-1,6-N-acetylglucosamine synthase-like glycosyltransferase
LSTLVVEIHRAKASVLMKLLATIHPACRNNSTGARERTFELTNPAVVMRLKRLNAAARCQRNSFRCRVATLWKFVMIVAPMLMALIFGGVSALFLSMGLSVLFHQRWVRRLPSLKALSANEGTDSAGRARIRCSVVIAARDEEGRIEETIHHLLAQQGVEMEVIVVDDRSTDRTPDILKRLAVSDARVRVKRVDILPEGWLGKCYACHLGAGVASGEWILFTDADCWLTPDVVDRALRVAEREGVDHVALTAGVGTEALAAQAWHLAFLISLSNWISGVNRDRRGAYFGMGAFNLVRASAYRECGGYEALRLTVLDDVKLGLLLRRAGKRTRAFLGGEDVECHWGTTLKSMVRIMEKNYFAALDFRLGIALAASVAGVLLLCGALIGPCTVTLVGLVAGLAPFSFILPAEIFARQLGWSWRAAALTPFILPVLLYAMVNSIIVTLRKRGIWWRETFYELETLRKGSVR